MRHSGFLSLTATVALTALAVAGHSSVLWPQPNSRDQQALSEISSATPLKSAHNHDPLAEREEREFVLEVGDVPKNARLIVASRDISGKPHIVTLDVTPRTLTVPGSVTSIRWPGPISVESTVVARHIHSHGLGVVSRVDRKTVDGVFEDSRQVIWCRADSPIAATGTIPETDSLKSRQFLVPHFEPHGTSQEVCRASLVAINETVAIYADEFLLEPIPTDPGRVARTDEVGVANKILQSLEMGVLELVQDCVGPIEDLDGNSRLSIVITDLDRRDDGSLIPVRGCVRDRDFLAFGDDDFAGDIVYLDDSLPSDTQLSAMLAHELTHAAVLSRMLEQRHSESATSVPTQPIPSWLNEAIAHWVELQLTATPEAFSHRINLFRSNPAVSPIVASDSSLSSDHRRGGSRAAGAMFLQQFAKRTDQLSSLLDGAHSFDENVALISGMPFHEVFQRWIESQAILSAAVNVSAAGFTGSSPLDHSPRLQKRVYGTSFFVLHCEDSIRQLRVTTDKSCQLQVTVLKPE